jgi:hypothetical protein
MSPSGLDSAGLTGDSGGSGTASSCIDPYSLNIVQIETRNPMKLVATLLVVLLGFGFTTKNRALAARWVENKCENSLRAVRRCTQVSVNVAEPECCKLLTTFKEMGCLSLW